MSEHKAREAREQERRKLLLEAIEKDVDSVVLRSDIIFGAISTGDGRYGIQSGEYSTSVVKQASYDLFFRSMMLFQHMEFQKAMQAQADRKIVVPDAHYR